MRNGMKVEDLCLTFVIPGTHFELCNNGANQSVTLENLEEFLDRLLQVMFVDSLKDQIKAFKKGFNQFFEIENLKMFKSYEIEDLVCGNSNDSEWTFDNILQFTLPAHGFHQKSQTYKNLINFMSSLNQDERKQFLKFVTGSSRLPFGGFKALNPLLTVVRKGEADK